MRTSTPPAGDASADLDTSPEIAPGGTSEQPPAATPNTARAREAAAAPQRAETGSERFRRKAHRGRLPGYAIATVGVVAVLIALAASNTAKVKVNWLVGTSHVSLVW